MSAYKQQPQLTCTVLELAVRNRPFWSWVAPSVTPSTDAQEAAAFAKLVLQMCAAAAPTAAALGTAHTRQLFACSASCLKLVATNTPGSSSAGQLEPALAAADAAIAAAGAFEMDGSANSIDLDLGEAAEGASSSSSSSSSRVPTGIRRMAMVLRANGLRHAGQAVLGGSPAPTADSSGAGSSAAAANPTATGGVAAAVAPTATPSLAIELSAVQLRSWIEAVHGLGLALPAVELPGGPGSEQACAAARQQLLQLQGRLQQDLQDALAMLGSASSGSSGGGTKSAGVVTGDCDSCSDVVAAGSAPDQLQQSDSSDLGAAAAAVAQQMVALGEALCAQLPLAHCCNNPGCVELRGASELQLVGGKGCVCSRCRWVA
jgi:hypothetical protein